MKHAVQIDRYGQKFVFLPCICGSKDHHVLISQYKWDDDATIDYEFCITLDPYLGFFGRLLLAAKYVLGLDRSKTVYHSVALTEQEFKDISSLFEDKTDG